MTIDDQRRQVLPFRPRRRALRSKRRRLGRWLAPLAAGTALFAAPLGFAAWLLISPSFALARVDIDTTGGRVSSRWVETMLAPLRGQNLFRLSLTLASERISDHPWVDSAAIRKVLPDRLVVHVVERVPVAVLREESGISFLDDRGSVIAPVDFSTGEAIDFLIVSRRLPESDPVLALELAERLAQLDPPWARGLAEIEILNHEDLEIQTASLPFPLLVNIDDLELKSARLLEILPTIVSRFGIPESVDLRFERRIIIKPPTAVDLGRSRASGHEARLLPQAYATVQADWIPGNEVEASEPREA